MSVERNREWHELTRGVQQRMRWTRAQSFHTYNYGAYLIEVINFDALNRSSHHLWSMVHSALTISAWRDR